MIRHYWLVLLAVFAMGVAALTGSHQAHSKNSVQSCDPQYRYESILVQKGDTLWSIAQNHCGSDLASDIQKYVKQLQRMNHIYDSRNLQAGSYLMIYHAIG